MKTAILMGCLILLLSATAQAESIIIVNDALPVSEISQSEAAKIFLGKKKSWDSGDKITAVTLKKGAVHNEFLKKVVKKSPSQFATYWKRIIFTGKGQALKSFDTEAELLDFVAKTTGAIGYIDAATPHPATHQLIIK